jgi:putative tryptophan/tyrosine transport system substrate-binding protein
VRRRDFIKVIAGSATVWPLVARAQQTDRVRRIGVLTNVDTTDRVDPFLQRLQRLGWTDGRNIQIDKRMGAANVDALRKHAAELVALAPDVILAYGTIPTAYLLQTTRTVPIVFTLVIDPLGGGLVDDLSRPGGNVTGFMVFEYSLSGKWLELLKQIAPGVTRAAILRDPASPAGTGQFAVIQSVAPSFGVELRPINLRDAHEIEQAVAAFARSANGGLVVTAVRRQRIIAISSSLLQQGTNYQRSTPTAFLSPPAD